MDSSVAVASKVFFSKNNFTPEIVVVVSESNINMLLGCFNYVFKYIALKIVSKAH